MKREKDIKELLIANAIHLIAEGGFEKATTKELTHCSGNLPDLKMNEVYIYRFFGSKEHLYESVFAHLDNELYYAFQDGVQAVGGFEGQTKEKLYEFFLMAWHFILDNEERCRCYIRTQGGDNFFAEKIVTKRTYKTIPRIIFGNASVL